MDTLSRTFMKTLSWRIIATLTTALLVYLFTGELKVAFAVGGIEALAKMALYFCHERVWSRIPFGKTPVTALQESSRSPVAPLREQRSNA